MSHETIDRVLHDLKVISSIRDNDKIYTENGMLNLDHGGVSSSMYRFVKGENRNRGLSAINNVILDAFAITENNFRKIECKDMTESREAIVNKMKSYHLIYKIRCSVSDCLIGLKNLRITYCDDTSISARIDVLKESISQGLKELDASLNLLKEQLYPQDEVIEQRYGEFLIRDDLHLIYS
tara:strand:- start:1764 stop:2306 length:543 start_codon:yes stop_codon:yes gene_type:complete